MLNAHSLVSIWGALEACVENLIALILTNHTGAIKNIDRIGIDTQKIDSAKALSFEDARMLYKKIENKCRVTSDIVKTYENILFTFELMVASAEDTELLKKANTLRNCILHNRSVIDAQAVKQVPLLKEWLSKKYVVTSEEFQSISRAIFAWLNSILKSIIESKYMKYKT